MFKEGRAFPLRRTRPKGISNLGKDKHYDNNFKLDFNTLVEWEALEERGKLLPKKRAILNKERLQIWKILKPAIDSVKKLTAEVDNVGKDLHRVPPHAFNMASLDHITAIGRDLHRHLEASKKTKPHAWRYYELYRKMWEGDPGFLHEVRLQIVKLGYRRGFPDVRLQSDGYLYSPTAGQLLEDKLAEVMSESENMLPKEFEKIPLRVLGRAKSSRKIEGKRLIIPFQDNLHGVFDPRASLGTIDIHPDEITKAVESLSTTQRRIISLMLKEGLTQSEISKILGISRAAVSKAYSAATRNLRTILFSS